MGNKRLQFFKIGRQQKTIKSQRSKLRALEIEKARLNERLALQSSALSMKFQKLEHKVDQMFSNPPVKRKFLEMGPKEEPDEQKFKKEPKLEDVEYIEEKPKIVHYCELQDSDDEPYDIPSGNEVDELMNSRGVNININTIFSTNTATVETQTDKSEEMLEIKESIVSTNLAINLDEQLTSFKSKVTELTTKVETLGAEVTSLKKVNEEHLENADKNEDLLASKIEELARLKSSNEIAISSMNKTLQKADYCKVMQEIKLDNLQKRSKGLNVELNGKDKNIEDLKKDVLKLNLEKTNFVQEIKLQSEANSDLKAQVTKLETKLREKENEIDGLDQYVDTLGAHKTSLEKELYVKTDAKTARDREVRNLRKCNYKLNSQKRSLGYKLKSQIHANSVLRSQNTEMEAELNQEYDEESQYSSEDEDMNQPSAEYDDYYDHGHPLEARRGSRDELCNYYTATRPYSHARQPGTTFCLLPRAPLDGAW